MIASNDVFEWCAARAIAQRKYRFVSSQNATNKIIVIISSSGCSDCNGSSESEKSNDNDACSTTFIFWGNLWRWCSIKSMDVVRCFKVLSEWKVHTVKLGCRTKWNRMNATRRRWNVVHIVRINIELLISASSHSAVQQWVYHHNLLNSICLPASQSVSLS